MHHDKGVDEAITVIVVLSKIDRRVGSEGGIPGHDIRARRTRWTAYAEIAVGVERQCLRKLKGADDLPDDVYQTTSGFFEIVLNAPVRQDAGREEEITEVSRRLYHSAVGKMRQHNDYAHGTSQWGSLRSRCADRA
jgi:hypothetical protein